MLPGSFCRACHASRCLVLEPRMYLKYVANIAPCSGSSRTMRSRTLAAGCRSVGEEVEVGEVARVPDPLLASKAGVQRGSVYLVDGDR